MSDLCRAEPEDVDREAVLALDDCDCGDHRLATVRVENAVYIAECGHCDNEVRAPVVVEDGTEKVRFDLEPEEVPLPA